MRNKALKSFNIKKYKDIWKNNQALKLRTMPTKFQF